MAGRARPTPDNTVRISLDISYFINDASTDSVFMEWSSPNNIKSLKSFLMAGKKFSDFFKVSRASSKKYVSVKGLNINISTDSENILITDLTKQRFLALCHYYLFKSEEGRSFSSPLVSRIVFEEPNPLVEVEAAILEAGNWAGLSLESARLGPLANNPAPPTTLEELAHAFRARIEMPSLLRVNLPDHDLAERIKIDAQQERERRRTDIQGWLKKLLGTEVTSLNDMEAPPTPSTSHPKPPPTPNMITLMGVLRPTVRKCMYSIRLTPYGRNRATPRRHLSSAIWVKTGDHSISAQGVTTNLLLEDSSTAVGPPNYIREFGPNLNEMRDRFPYVAGQAIQVGSYASVSQPGGGFTPEELVTGNALAFHEAPIGNAGDVRHNLHVHTGAAREIGVFDEATIGDFLIGGVPNEKAISNVMQPELRCGNRHALVALAASIRRGMRYFDNEMLYAKL